jgi:hypothetical protein
LSKGRRRRRWGRRGKIVDRHFFAVFPDRLGNRSERFLARLERFQDGRLVTPACR